MRPGMLFLELAAHIKSCAKLSFDKNFPPMNSVLAYAFQTNPHLVLNRFRNMVLLTVGRDGHEFLRAAHQQTLRLDAPTSFHVRSQSRKYSHRFSRTIARSGI